MTMFEVSALSWTELSLSLEHPTEESMATAEIDLRDITNLVCRIRNPGSPPSPNAPDPTTDLASKILNRCFSIPIAMRSVIKLWERQASRRNHNTGYNGHENFNLALGSGDPGGHKGGSGSSMTEFGGLDKLKQEPGGNSGMLGHHGMFLETNFTSFPSTEGVLTNMELTNILSGQVEKKRQKRMSRDEVLWKNNKRKMGDDSDLLVESSSCDSTSRSTPISQDNEISTPNSGLGFQSDLELSGLDPAELLGDKVPHEFGNLDELVDVEEMLAGPSRDCRRKSRDQKSPQNIILDLGEKNLVPPSVSITPIPTTSPLGYISGGNPEKRPGIEIIPLGSSPASTLPSSITLTPIISQSNKSTEDKSRSERKSSGKSRSDDKNRLEKKRKRKRDESPMGPPEKVPLKQDPLTKPVTVSIKPAGSPPLPISTPTSPGMIRKFNASPTPNRVISGKLSPSLIKPALKSSPKHSPGHVPSSPKHSIAGISSPKSHGTSPKHPSTSGSGKPSMSTLKSAANSPSSKSGESKTKSKDSNREKDKKSTFTVANSSKTKSSIKVKPLDLNSDSLVYVQDGLPSPSSIDPSKLANQNQAARNRKGSLLSIVDKLKSAQHCDIVTDLSNKSGGNRERSGQTGKITDGKKATGVENKNSEYMVKPSSDGMKITINKTRTKESKSGLGKTGTGSPKTHTGLKPGVNSGPASKKPQQKITSNLNSTGYNVAVKTGSKLPSNKIPSSGANKSLTKLTGSPKSSDPNRKTKPKSGEKSIFSSKDGRKSSPTPTREEGDSVFKLNKMDPYPSPLVMEGMMKQLDKNFQIPKLSARTGDDKKPKNESSVNNVNRSTVDTKIFDLMTKTDLPKYPLAIPGSKIFENAIDSKVRNNTTSPITNKDGAEEERKEQPQNLMVQPTATKDDLAGFKINYPGITVSKNFTSSAMVAEPLSLSTKSIDLTSKFVAPAPKEDKKEAKKSDNSEGLLDFSQSVVGKNDGKISSATFPQSPSVSVHIVKSPAQSPLILPSPHSASPCITDDELMDEALIGIGK